MEYVLVTCPDCEGECKVMIARLYPNGHTECWDDCERCDGDGEIEIVDPNTPWKTFYEP